MTKIVVYNYLKIVGYLFITWLLTSLNCKLLAFDCGAGFSKSSNFVGGTLVDLNSVSGNAGEDSTRWEGTLHWNTFSGTSLPQSYLIPFEVSDFSKGGLSITISAPITDANRVMRYEHENGTCYEFSLESTTDLTQNLATVIYLPLYTVSTSVSPSEGGTVGFGISGSSGNAGESIQIIASASNGHEFTSWSGDVSGSDNPLTVTLDSNKTISANFSAVASSLAFDCGASFSKSSNFVDGALVDLNSVSGNAGEDSTRWEGTLHWNTFSGTSLPQSYLIPFEVSDFSKGGLSITISAPITDANRVMRYEHENGTCYEFSLESTTDLTQNLATVIYLPLYTVSTSVSPSEGGTVGFGISGSSGNAGESIQIIASASNGHEFTSWSGDVSGSDNPLTVTLDSNKTISANFSVDASDDDARAAGISLVTSTPGDYSLMTISSHETALEDMNTSATALGRSAGISLVASTPGDYSLMTISSHETALEDMNTSATALGRNAGISSVTSTPGDYSLMTISSHQTALVDMNASATALGRNAGISLVTSTPSDYSLLTISSHETALDDLNTSATALGRSAGISLVTSTPSDYSLLTISSHETALEDMNTSATALGRSAGISLVTSTPSDYNLITIEEYLSKLEEFSDTPDEDILNEAIETATSSGIVEGISLVTSTPSDYSLMAISSHEAALEDMNISATDLGRNAGISLVTSTPSDYSLMAISSHETALEDMNTSATALGRNAGISLVMSTPSDYSLMAISSHEATLEDMNISATALGRNAGISLVTSAPADYSLMTVASHETILDDLNASATADGFKQGENAVIESPADYNLMTTEYHIDKLQELSGTPEDILNEAIATATSTGFVNGVSAVTSKPGDYSLISLSFHDKALEEMNVSAASRGFETGVDEVVSIPANYSLISISSHDKEIESTKSDGIAEGINLVIENPTLHRLVSRDQYDLMLNEFANAETNSSPYTDGWFYVPNMGWLFTVSESFPYFYDSISKSWLYFQSGNDKPRFYDFNTSKWFTMEWK